MISALERGVLLRRQSLVDSRVVHLVLLRLEGPGFLRKLGLLVVEGDRPLVEVYSRYYPVGVYDVGDSVSLVEGESYITERAYGLLASRDSLYGRLVVTRPDGLAGVLRLSPPLGSLRFDTVVGRLRLEPNTRSLRI